MLVACGWQFAMSALPRFVGLAILWGCEGPAMGHNTTGTKTENKKRFGPRGDPNLLQLGAR